MPLTEAIAIGLVVGFFLHEWLGLSPGGFVVPGYVALYLDQPAVLLATAVTGLAAWGLVHGLSRWLILYGRRRFILMVLAAFAIRGLVEAGTGGLPAPWPHADVIGYIIPGLVANECDRQGPLPTLGALALLTVIVRLALIALGRLPVW